MKLIEKAQAFIRQQDDSNDDEHYETAKERAESVLCEFLRSLNMPVWRVQFVWRGGGDCRTITNYFVLEETADGYITDEMTRLPKASIGTPTEVLKCLTRRS